MPVSFNVNEADLAYILRQIKVSELESLAVLTPGVTTEVTLLAIIGTSSAPASPSRPSTS